MLVLRISNFQGANYQPMLPQYQYAFSPNYSPYISYGIGWENLCKNQDILSLMIISFILMTCMLDQVGIL